MINRPIQPSNNPTTQESQKTTAANKQTPSSHCIMKFTSTLVALVGLFIASAIANPVPVAEAEATVDNPLERRCTANYSQYLRIRRALKTSRQVD